MSTHTSIERLTVHGSSRAVTDEVHTTTPATTDPESYAQDRNDMFPDIEVVDNQSNVAAGAARCSGTKTDLSPSSADSSANIYSGISDSLPMPTSAANSSAKTSTDTANDNLDGAEHSIAYTPHATPTETTHDDNIVASLFAIPAINHVAGEKSKPEAPGDAIPSGTLGTEAACSAMQSTAPVPVVYPPRRPNIFRTRQKHVRFPLSDLGAVAPRTVGTTTRELEAADGFSMPDLQEFQAEVKERMKRKSKIFMNMVRQSAPVWQRRVEDLGEVFQIED